MPKNKYIWWALYTITTVIILFSYRWIFTTQTDITYLQNLYDHSQWRLPLSTRIMSDNELYQISGYNIIQGADLFSISPEVPPLGKYIYGLSIKSLNNPYWVSILLFILSTYIFILLIQKTLKNTTAKYLAMFLFISSPLIFSQLAQTMMDLPQLLFLLIHILTIIHITQKSKSKTILSILAGITISAFASTKIAAFLPVIILADAYWFYINRQLRSFIIVLITSAATFPLFYLPYFLSGHSPIQWLRSIKWTLQIYLGSNVKSHPYNAFISIITGWYKPNLENSTWQYIRDYNILWPMLLVAPSILIKKRANFSKLSLVSQYLIILTSLFLLAYVLLPSVPRYLILVLPLIILIISEFIAKKRILVIATMAIIVIQLILFLNPSPSSRLQFAVSDWQNGNYQDLYNHLYHPTIDRQEFLTILKKVDQQTMTRSKEIQIDFPKTLPWQTMAKSNVLITYHTALGDFIYQHPINFTKYQNIWQINWDWNLIGPKYQPQDTFNIRDFDWSTGIITTLDGQIISQPGDCPHPFVTIHPDQLEQSTDLLKLLDQISETPYAHLEYKIFVEGYGRQSVDVGFLKKKYTQDQYDQLIGFPAVIIETRNSCPDRGNDLNITELEQMKKIRQVEALYQPDIDLYNGKITLDHQDGNQQLVLESHRDIVLEQTLDEILK